MDNSGRSADTRRLVGRALAEEAWSVAREVDPERLGLKVKAVETALAERGILLGGSGKPSVLSSALNGDQRQFEGLGRGFWLWRPWSPEAGLPSAGLAGASLADEAYPIARTLDPAQRGLHYGRIVSELQKSGVSIQGSNAGQTVYAALRDASDWFEWLGSGRFRWR